MLASRVVFQGQGANEKIYGLGEHRTGKVEYNCNDDRKYNYIIMYNYKNIIAMILAMAKNIKDINPMFLPAWQQHTLLMG